MYSAVKSKDPAHDASNAIRTMPSKENIRKERKKMKYAEVIREPNITGSSY